MFATTAWYIWAHRNKTRFKEQPLPLDRIKDTAWNFLQLFKADRDTPCRSKPSKPVRRCKWLPPKPGEYKINFNIAMFNESEEARIDIVACDFSGHVLATLVEKIRKPYNMENM
ncbi:hypothetical protein ACB092_01G075200 [Castanea dentata]